MNRFNIPRDRSNITTKEFTKQLEWKRATKKLSLDVLYSKLKYKIIFFCSTWGMVIAISVLILSTIFNFDEIKSYSIFYIQTVITLFIGALISKTL